MLCNFDVESLQISSFFSLLCSRLFCFEQSSVCFNFFKTKHKYQWKKCNFRHSPPFAVTIKSSWCINTYVVTASVIEFTFVHRTLIFWLVLALRTVNSFITNFGIWYAHSATTIKLGGTVTSSYRSS